MNTTQDDTRILHNSMLCKVSYDDIIQACNGENYTMSLTGNDAQVVIKAVNIGIDSRLQGCFVKGKDSYAPGERSITATEDTDHWKQGDKLVLANTLECDISPESLCVLLRRLYEDMEYTGEDGDDNDVATSLAESILMSLGFNDYGKFVGRKALGLD